MPVYRRRSITSAPFGRSSDPLATRVMRSPSTMRTASFTTRVPSQSFPKRMTFVCAAATSPSARIESTITDGSYQDRAHVQQREALALRALLRVRSRLRRHHRHVAATAARLGQPLAQEGRLHAVPSMLRKRRGAAQLRDAVRDPHAAAAGGLAVAPRKILHEAIHFVDVFEDVVEGLSIDRIGGRRGVERVRVQEAGRRPCRSRERTHRAVILATATPASDRAALLDRRGIERQPQHVLEPREHVAPAREQRADGRIGERGDFDPHRRGALRELLLDLLERVLVDRLEAEPGDLAHRRHGPGGYGRAAADRPYVYLPAWALAGGRSPESCHQGRFGLFNPPDQGCCREKHAESCHKWRSGMNSA